MGQKWPNIIIVRLTFLPKQVYLWCSILEKQRLDTLVGALCCVGRGFGCAGALLGADLARWAGLVVSLALVGGLGWVGRGFGFLCMVYTVASWWFFDLVDLLALFGVYAGIILVCIELLTRCDQSPIFVGSMERDSKSKADKPLDERKVKSLSCDPTRRGEACCSAFGSDDAFVGTKLRFHVGCVAESPGAVAR